MAVKSLGEPGEAHEQKARTTLDSLIRLHPKSKWKDTAILLLKLLDERKELFKQSQNERGMVERLQGEKDELQHEAEQLKKDLQSLQDKLQVETARFQQENDLLKKDIERLKSLEIELQERGKMLR
jgi:peptidoglycan hydrolase CwlO-like protein